jgi:hypothetical protein
MEEELARFEARQRTTFQQYLQHMRNKMRGIKVASSQEPVPALPESKPESMITPTCLQEEPLQRSLSRSSGSSLSSASASSSQQLESDDSFAAMRCLFDINDEVSPPPKSKNFQKKTDRNIVRQAVLTAFDAQWLAPLQSELFQRQFRSKLNPNGTRCLKKNKDLHLPLFRKILRPVLRTLLGEAGIRDLTLVDRF